MEKKLLENNAIILRLTYLWAFVEGGLGGLLHLFHIPITGFVVGGFSILINVVLAKYSHTNTKIILSSLGIVLLTKFALSPYSPLGAYAAVIFQSLMCIVIFKSLSIHRISIFIYSGLCMIENAIQKPLLAWIIFGKELWDGIFWATNQFFKNPSISELSIYVILFVYFGLHILCAILVAIWTSELIERIGNYRLPNGYQFIDFTIKTGESKKGNALIYLMVIILSLTLLYLYKTNQNVFIYVLRIGIVYVFLALLAPFIFRKIIHYYERKNVTEITTVLAEIPRIKRNTISAYQYTKQFSGFNRIKEFIFLVVYLNVFYIENES